MSFYFQVNIDLKTSRCIGNRINAIRAKTPIAFFLEIIWKTFEKRKNAIPLFGRKRILRKTEQPYSKHYRSQPLCFEKGCETTNQRQ